MSALTVAELRSLVPGLELEDAALQIYIDAAEEQLGAFPVGSVTDVYGGNSSVIILRHPVSSVTSVREADETADLDPGEYRLSATDSRSLWRKIPGYSGPGTWSGPVTVTSVLRSYTNLRKLITAQLVKGAANNNPGVLGMTEGNWTIQYANGESWETSIDDALAAAPTHWNFA